MIPTLETERLILRAPELADAPSGQLNFSDYDVIRDLAAAVPWPYPPDGMARFIASLPAVQGAGRWVWCLFLKAAPCEMVGNVDLRRDDPLEIAVSGWRASYGAAA